MMLIYFLISYSNPNELNENENNENYKEEINNNFKKDYVNSFIEHRFRKK